MDQKIQNNQVVCKRKVKELSSAKFEVGKSYTVVNKQITHLCSGDFIIYEISDGETTWKFINTKGTFKFDKYFYTEEQSKKELRKLKLKQLNRKNKIMTTIKTKPTPIVNVINTDLVKITIYKRSFLSKLFGFGYKPYTIYWRKRYDKSNGQFMFFNDDNSLIFNCEAQEAIESRIKDGKIMCD